VSNSPYASAAKNEPNEENNYNDLTFTKEIGK
jgi:hypothetical protein